MPPDRPGRKVAKASRKRKDEPARRSDCKAAPQSTSPSTSAGVDPTAPSVCVALSAAEGKQQRQSTSRRRRDGRGGLSRDESVDDPIPLDTAPTSRRATRSMAAGLLPPAPKTKLTPSIAEPVQQHSVLPVRPQDPVPVDALGEAISTGPRLADLTGTSSLGPKTLRQGQDHHASTSTTTASGVSYFAGAQGVSMNNTSITTHSAPSKSLFELLNPHVAHGAAHDSNDRRDAPACHKETRVAIREDIVGWIKQDDGDEEPNKIMWLSGPAGSGKSAIAGSVAELCNEEGLLAAAFFFSSFSPSTDRRWSRGVIATLVHHMSQHDALDLYQAQLLTAIERRPDIFHKNLKEQAKHLILTPFRKIHGQSDRAGWPKVVIIDGVDEVVAPEQPQSGTPQVQRTSEDDQVEVLEVLLFLHRSRYFPFRIFVTSRPEKNITDFFADAESPIISRFLDAKYNPDADIKRYLKSKFAQIRRHFHISDVLWPGRSAVDRIIDMSSGQFIVPTTVIRWIKAGVPQQQLAEVMQLRSVGTTSRNPFATLDALYRHILIRAHNPENDSRLVIKWILSITFASRHTPKAMFWRQFLEDRDGELNYRMAPISSLISVPPPDDTSSPITFYHKSLIDYLSAESRCGDLHVGKTVQRSFIAGRIVGVLRNKGPTVPFLPQDLDSFICLFTNLELTSPLIVGWTTSVSGALATFLHYLSGDQGLMDTLVSCDVAWWTNWCLHAAVGLDTKPLHLLRGMYFGIHKAMKCDENTWPINKHSTRQEQVSRCHKACTHWRMGILAKAKKLGRCVHEVEVLPLGKLQNVTVVEAERMFDACPRGVKPCAICNPTRST